MGEIGYKGFEKGLVCKGKQYAENTIFEEPEAVVCKKGMHYCKNPFDVLDYYDLVDSDGSFNEFATVEPLAEEKTNDNKKYCTTKLKIGAKFNFSGFIKACVDFVIEKTNGSRIIVEVKPKSQTYKPTVYDNLWAKEAWVKNMDKWAAAYKFAKEHKMSFIVVCENLQVRRITEDMVNDYINSLRKHKINKIEE